MTENYVHDKLHKYVLIYMRESSYVVYIAYDKHMDVSLSSKNTYAYSKLIQTVCYDTETRNTFTQIFPFTCFAPHHQVDFTRHIYTPISVYINDYIYLYRCDCIFMLGSMSVRVYWLL